MNPIEQLNGAILWILELRGPALMATILLAIGYIARFLPWIPNKFIPQIVILSGTATAPLFIPLSGVGTVDPGIPWPTVTVWAELLTRGMIIGLSVWLSHELLISKLEDKLKAIGVKTPTAAVPPPVIPVLQTAAEPPKPAA